MTEQDLYRAHLATLDRDLGRALELAREAGLGLDGVVFHAGRVSTYHADDHEIVFHATPHFRRWIPLPGPEHLLLARPGERPTLVAVHPRDYWVDTTPPPPSYWESSVDVRVVESAEQAPDALGTLGRVAYVGNSPDVAVRLGLAPELVEPEELLAPLDWFRATKTTYEVGLAEAAIARAAAGHLAARDAYLAGDTEIEIYWSYVRGTGQVEHELPFGSIVALDEKSAILHYQHKRSTPPQPGRVLLVDAGASHGEFAADLTRTWTSPDADPIFRALVEGVDRLERELVALVTPGRSYVEIHLAANRLVAELLVELGILVGDPEGAVERGVTCRFMPHGVGHHLGFQVHDVGGRQAGPSGGTNAPPDRHPYLRTTRRLEPGHLVTIEPGVYFVPMLLDELRASPDADLVDWSVVDRLVTHGGVRIEDDVLCTEGAPRDLSRDLLPGPSEA